MSFDEILIENRPSAEVITRLKAVRAQEKEAALAAKKKQQENEIENIKTKLSYELRLGQSQESIDIGESYPSFIERLSKSDNREDIKLENKINNMSEILFDRISKLLPKNDIDNDTELAILNYFSNLTAKEIRSLQYWSLNDSTRSTFQELITQNNKIPEALKQASLKDFVNNLNSATLNRNNKLTILIELLRDRYNKLKKFYVGVENNDINSGVKIIYVPSKNSLPQFKNTYIIQPLTPEFSINWASSYGKQLTSLCTAMKGSENQLTTYLKGGKNSYGEPINAGPVYYMTHEGKNYFLSFSNAEFLQIGSNALITDELKKILSIFHRLAPTQYTQGIMVLQRYNVLKSRLAAALNPAETMKMLEKKYRGLPLEQREYPSNIIKKILTNPNAGTSKQFKELFGNQPPKIRDNTDYFGKMPFSLRQQDQIKDYRSGNFSSTTRSLPVRKTGATDKQIKTGMNNPFPTNIFEE